MSELKEAAAELLRITSEGNTDTKALIAAQARLAAALDEPDPKKRTAKTK
jgi:hypothetical protein